MQRQAAETPAYFRFNRTIYSNFNTNGRREENGMKN